MDGVANTKKIAVWDGTSWSDVGGGLGSDAYSLAIFDGALYVGGRFDNAGGDAGADRVAKWDNSTWSELDGGIGSNLFDRVWSMVPAAVSNIQDPDWPGDEEALYLGGSFLTAGPSQVYDSVRIARWGLRDSVAALLLLRRSAAGLFG